MSSLVVSVARIDDVLPHRNADNLELAQIMGWQVVILKGAFRKSDKVIYFPPDTILPLEWSEKFDVTRYLHNQRIKCVKLRGEPSFGLVVPPPEGTNWEIGENVAQYYSATKYEPPVRITVEDAAIPHPLFPPYTHIENIRNFPDILENGEEVFLTEKIHGSNCRVGIVDGEFMAGSHEVRRKQPEDFSKSLYWFPLTIPSVKNMLEELGKEHQQVVLYGEIFGKKIQSLHYGLTDSLGFRAFDLLIDGKYQNYYEFKMVCKEYNIMTVPTIAVIDYSLEKVKEWSEGTTTLMRENPHIREGVVVRPMQERTDPKIGRVILKCISDSYLLMKEKKGHTDFTDK